MREISILVIAILMSITCFTGCQNKIITPTPRLIPTPTITVAISTVSSSEFTSEEEKPSDSDISSDSISSGSEGSPWYTIDEADDPHELKAYHKILADLPVNNITSVSSAIDRYKELVCSDKTVNDRLFWCFESFYYNVIEEMSNLNSGVIDDDKVELFKLNGIEQYYSEAGPFIWIKPGFLYDQFASTTSDALREWLKISKNEEIQQGYTYFVEDALLVISWNDLSDRIIVWEKFIKDYGDYERFGEYAQSSIDFYLWLYMDPPYQGMKTFPYMNGKTGENELKLSYERFIKYHATSEYMPTIKGYYDILLRSDFIVNQEAREYLEENGIDTSE